MALYLIGDVQGCDDALSRLLDVINFSPSRDTLIALGDLVNRGPQSAAVLRRLSGLGSSATCVLGNHDLHLLAVAHSAQTMNPGDTFYDVLQAPDRNALLKWLKHQRLAQWLPNVGDRPMLMVHAGVLPDWSARETLELAAEVESSLQEINPAPFLKSMYGNTPASWNANLNGTERLRVAVNALTRIRYCSADGMMNFDAKDGLCDAPPGCTPWFDIASRRTADITVAFGHWSTLGWFDRKDALCLDTGCVWGGPLTAVKLDTSTRERQRFQVPCAPLAGSSRLK